MLSGLTIFIVPLCATAACRWRFSDCVRVGEKWALECNVTLHLLNESLDKCGDRLQTKTIFLDSEEGVEFDDKCDINGCAIRPVWCPWERWSPPRTQCNEERLVRRRQRICCHPTTLRRDRRVACGRQTKHDSRRLPWLPCDDDSALRDDRQLFGDVTIACCGLFIVLVVVCVFYRCYRRFKSRRRTLASSRTERPLTTMVLTPQRPPTPSQTPPLSMPQRPSPPPSHRTQRPPSLASLIPQRPPTPPPTTPGQQLPTPPSSRTQQPSPAALSMPQRSPTPPLMPQRPLTPPSMPQRPLTPLSMPQRSLTPSLMPQRPLTPPSMPQQPLASTPVLRHRPHTVASAMPQRSLASAPELVRPIRSRVFRAQQLPDSEDAFPVFLENDPLINPLSDSENEPPPSYDTINDDCDSPPPRYETAIMFVP